MGATKEMEAMGAAEAQEIAVAVVALADVVFEGQAERWLEGLGQTPCCPVMAGQMEGPSTQQ